MFNSSTSALARGLALGAERRADLSKNKEAQRVLFGQRGV